MTIDPAHVYILSLKTLKAPCVIQEPNQITPLRFSLRFCQSRLSKRPDPRKPRQVGWISVCHDPVLFVRFDVSYGRPFVSGLRESEPGASL